MKKITLVAIGTFLTVAGFSQFSFGVQATGNVSSASVKLPDVNFTKTAKGLPGAGIVAQYDLSEKIAIRSGVNYLQHGVIVKAMLDPTADLNIEAENTLHYVQVPVNVLYNMPVGSVKLYAGLGGFVNYGVGGTSTQTTRITMPDGEENVIVEKMKAFKKEEDGGAGLKKFDAGASALAGVKFNNGLFANVGYQHSFTNISEGEGKYKNQGLQLSVGYFF